jgi:Raf kinase inhibitor-like YbhB/YbcL family protein
MSTDPYLGAWMALAISSPAFRDGEQIPVEFTCDGSNTSPALHWSGAPSGTRTFALVCDDPDAPARTFVHWVIYNLPAAKSSLAPSVPPKGELDEGVLQGLNSARRVGYVGPCPPHGRHRYFFKLYALDKSLALSGSPTKEELQTAMKGHIIEETQLVGTYERTR